jgi:hypothetical protein
VEAAYAKIKLESLARPQREDASLLILGHRSLSEKHLDSEILEPLESGSLELGPEAVHHRVSRVNEGHALVRIVLLRVGSELNTSSASADDNQLLGVLDATLDLLKKLDALLLALGTDARRKLEANASAGSDDKIVVRDAFARTLDLDISVADQLDPVVHPSDKILSRRRQVGAVGNEGLLLVALDDAEPRECPCELVVGVGLDDDDPPAPVEWESGSEEARRMVAGERSADDDHGPGLCRALLATLHALRRLCRVSHGIAAPDVVIV